VTVGLDSLGVQEKKLGGPPRGALSAPKKRPSPSGQTHLVLLPVASLRRLAALVPPPRAHLVRYFGVFAPNARVRPRVVPASPDPPSRARAASCPLVPEPVLTRPARRPIFWAELLKRTFQTDVLTCPRCGGTRRVVAVVLRSPTAQAILEHLRLPSRPLPLAPATSPP
jgi:hypothetical protein